MKYLAIFTIVLRSELNLKMEKTLKIFFCIMITICNNESTLIVISGIMNTYDVAGKVQIIPVVIYPTGVTTTGVVTGQAWNGSTGGVLLLESPSLALNHNFDMLGKGFAGGITVDRSSSCCNTSAIDSPGN